MVEPASFVAGLSLPQSSDDASTLLQLARTDGYDFVTTSLPYFPTSPDSSNSQPLPTPRKDVTALESKWWSTSVVGCVLDPSPTLPVLTTSSGGDSVMTDSMSEHNDGSGIITALCASTAPPTLASRIAEKHLRSMVEWASHMSIPALILPPIPTNPVMSLNYARLLSTVSLECSATNVQLWVRTPLTQRALAAFDILHGRCGGASNLGMLLYFDSTSVAGTTSVAPTGPAQQASIIGETMTLVHLAIGRNLKAASFATNIFLTNKRGYPTLSKSHQMLFTELLRRLGRTLRVLVEGSPVHHISTPDANGATGCLAYLQYLRHLRSRPEVSGVLDTEESQMESSYLDHLQSPLQPLGDNLEFHTYETFEKDPVKYRQYTHAVELALRDGMALSKFAPIGSSAGGGDGSPKMFVVRIMVVGAGRGPLIRSALTAVENVNLTLGEKKIRIEILGLEKNPSAVLYLRSVQAREPSWAPPAVTIIQGDMRYLEESTNKIIHEMKVQGKTADILISELLGSFGDNELSPECLDGVYKSGLVNVDTVCIPQRYTSHVAPVSSMRLHSEARAQSYSPASSTDGPEGQPAGTLRAMETPYVVRSHAAAQTHIERPCWEFVHPKPTKTDADEPTPSGNDRYARLVFTPDFTHGAGSGSGYGPFDSAVASMAQSAASPSLSPGRSPHPVTIHGFLGTFHSVLYQSPLGDGAASVISIAPTTFSVGMFSWFPLYFPLREPLHVPSGASIGATFWRRVEEGESGRVGRVWYEWCAEVISPEEVGVTNGSSSGNSGSSSKGGTVIASSAVHNPNGRSYHVRL